MNTKLKFAGIYAIAFFCFSASSFALTCGAKGTSRYYAVEKRACYWVGNKCQCSSANLGANNIAPGMPGYNKRELDRQIAAALKAEFMAASGARKTALRAQLRTFEATMEHR